MDIEWDPDKRAWTLLARGLDFARAGEVFAQPRATAQDLRRPYGEVRYVTTGFLDGCLVVMVWTPRGNCRRVISMRRANGREIQAFESTTRPGH